MRSIIIALTTLAASAFLPAVAGAECLHSLEAARSVHPTGHISWSGPRAGHARCYFADGERHTKVAARSPVPRQRPHTAPPIRTVPIDETAPRWPQTTEMAPVAPVQVADLRPNEPLREAMESYVVNKYWVLLWRDQQRRELEAIR